MKLTTAVAPATMNKTLLVVVASVAGALSQAGLLYIAWQIFLAFP